MLKKRQEILSKCKPYIKNTPDEDLKRHIFHNEELLLEPIKYVKMLRLHTTELKFEFESTISKYHENPNDENLKKEIQIGGTILFYIFQFYYELLQKIKPDKIQYCILYVSADNDDGHYINQNISINEVFHYLFPDIQLNIHLATICYPTSWARKKYERECVCIRMDYETYHDSGLAYHAKRDIQAIFKKYADKISIDVIVLFSIIFYKILSNKSKQIEAYVLPNYRTKITLQEAKHLIEHPTLVFRFEPLKLSPREIFEFCYAKFREPFHDSAWIRINMTNAQQAIISKRKSLYTKYRNLHFG